MIKKIFDPGNYSQKINVAILFLRVAIGLLMLTHGWGKLLMLLGGGPIEFADPIGIGPTFSLILSVFAEFCCSILLIVGLATRLAAMTLVVNMAVAFFLFHSADAFKVKELALIFLVVYITLSITGGGGFSIDKNMYNRKKTN